MFVIQSEPDIRHHICVAWGKYIVTCVFVAIRTSRYHLRMSGHAYYPEFHFVLHDIIISKWLCVLRGELYKAAEFRDSCATSMYLDPDESYASAFGNKRGIFSVTRHRKDNRVSEGILDSKHWIQPRTTCYLYVTGSTASVIVATVFVRCESR